MLAILSTTFISNSENKSMNQFEMKGGLYHLAGGGHTSRYEWTKSIINHIPKDITVKVKRVLPAKSVEFPAPATRPMFSALNCDKFENSFSLKIPGWETSLKLMFEH